jgi:hypothetical protein
MEVYRMGRIRKSVIDEIQSCKEEGLTDVETAEKLGVSRDTVRKYKDGEPPRPQTSTPQTTVQKDPAELKAESNPSIDELGDLTEEAMEPAMKIVEKLPVALRRDEQVMAKIKELVLTGLEARIAEQENLVEEAEESRVETAAYQAGLALRTVRELESAIYALCRCGEPIRLMLECGECGSRYLVNLPDQHHFDVLKGISDGTIQI